MIREYRLPKTGAGTLADPIRPMGAGDLAYVAIEIGDDTLTIRADTTDDQDAALQSLVVAP